MILGKRLRETKVWRDKRRVRERQRKREGDRERTENHPRLVDEHAISECSN